MAAVRAAVVRDDIPRLTVVELGHPGRREVDADHQVPEQVQRGGHLVEVAVVDPRERQDLVTADTGPAPVRQGVLDDGAPVGGVASGRSGLLIETGHVAVALEDVGERHLDGGALPVAGGRLDHVAYGGKDAVGPRIVAEHPPAGHLRHPVDEGRGWG